MLCLRDGTWAPFAPKRVSVGFISMASSIARTRVAVSSIDPDHDATPRYRAQEPELECIAPGS